MLTEYIQAALKKAHYEIMEDGRYWGEIPGLQGVWADGDTLEECRETLREVLEDWLLVRLRERLRIPLLDGVDPNALRLLGYDEEYGSVRHGIMRRGSVTVAVPDPEGRDVEDFLLRRILRQAEVTPDEFDSVK